MYRVLFFLCLVTNVFATTSLSIPKAKMDPRDLAVYLPFIQQELGGELSLQNDGRTKRRTIEYGYSFFRMEKGDYRFNRPPYFLEELGRDVCRALGREPKQFTNIILSQYGPGYSLEPHVDVGKKDRYPGADFYFDEEVYGIVIQPDPTGHLFFVRWNGGLKPPLGLNPVYALKEEQGSVFCLQGPLRKTPYFHGVSRVAGERISVTFRTVHICKPRE